MTAALEMKQVSKQYGDVYALRDVSLKLNEGEIMGLLGHNGAGKTTTMKLVLGVINPSQGQVSMFGESPTGPEADTLRRNMGYLPENATFYNQLTGREVLDYFGKLKGVASSAQSDLLERVGISHAADRRVKTYSKGMRQRLGLAQALLGYPKLLMLDEPTAGLDPTATREFYEILTELRKQGTSVLISSHVLPGIEKYIDSIAILGGGRVLAVGTPEQLGQDADLPLIVRVHGDWHDQNIDWQGQFARQQVSLQHVNGTRLELSTPINNKLSVMRTLLAESSVKDIDMIAPSLDDLYAHYNKQGKSLS